MEPEILPLGRVVAEAVRWQFEGQPRITLVAKATFALAEGAPMKLLDPEPFRASRATGVGDLVPFRPRADVLVFGDPAAYPDGVDVLITRGAPILETRADVLADRGGAGRLGRKLDGVADDVDWASFQEAPASQQAPLLSAGDRVAVGRLHGTMPACRGVLYVADKGVPATEGDRIDMDADALLIDLDRGRCSLLFRSVFVLEDEAAELDGRVLHVGIEPDEDADPSAAEALGFAPAGAAVASARDAVGGTPASAAGVAEGVDPRSPGAWPAAAGDTASGDSAAATSSAIARSSSTAAVGSAARSDPYAGAGAFSTAAPAEPSAEASAFSSNSDAKTRVRRSAPSTVAPTLPGTTQIRSSLYARFR